MKEPEVSLPRGRANRRTEVDFAQYLTGGKGPMGPGGSGGLTWDSMMVSSPSASLFSMTPFLRFRSPITVPWNSVGACTCNTHRSR